MKKMIVFAGLMLASVIACEKQEMNEEILTIEETRSFTESWVSDKTSKGATLPSLSRITFNGLGHYNNTISMEFEDLEYYNSSATGSEVVFSASDPYAGTFWITIKMNETGVPYGYVLNNTNGSNDYISGGNLEVVAAPGQVRLIGRAKKGISGTQYWTQTMTFVMYQ